MKKLIVAAAVVCSTVMAHAAAANWKGSASQIHDGTGSASALYSGTAYIFDAGVTSQSALFNMIVEGTAIGSSTAGYVTSATVSGGTFSGLNFSYGEQGSADTISYYFVIVDTDKAYFSNEKGAKPNATATAMLLVTTFRFFRTRKASATHAPVVPVLINKVSPSRIILATASAMARFWGRQMISSLLDIAP